MAKLQHVDPRTLSSNPDNPRRTLAPQAMDDQLLASIKTVGMIHPPIVTDRTKSSITGYYLDQCSAEVKTVVYRMPADKKLTTAKNTANGAGGSDTLAAPAQSRPDVTQKGCAVIRDFRTDALHQALRDSKIDDTTMIALLVLALSAKNVFVHSGLDNGRFERDTISRSITEGGSVTSDADQIRTAARTVLTTVLSCRTNMSNSGIVARVAGETIGASQHLPHMATEEFLQCLSRSVLEKLANDAGVPVDVRVKDTRAALIDRFASGVYLYPGALFRLTEQEIADARQPDSYCYVPGSAAEDDKGADWSDDDPNADEPGFTND